MGYTGKEIQKILEVYEKTRMFVKKVLRGEVSYLLLTGNAGTGKTHLAYASKKVLESRQKRVMFIHWYNFIDSVYEWQKSEVGTPPSHYYNRIPAHDVLVLEDVSYMPDTDFARKIMMRLIDTVYAHNKSLLITSNFSKEDFRRLMSEPVIDRLYEHGIFVRTNYKTFRKR